MPKVRSLICNDNPSLPTFKEASPRHPRTTSSTTLRAYPTSKSTNFSVSYDALQKYRLGGSDRLCYPLLPFLCFIQQRSVSEIDSTYRVPPTVRAISITNYFHCRAVGSLRTDNKQTIVQCCSFIRKQQHYE